MKYAILATLLAILAVSAHGKAVVEPDAEPVNLGTAILNFYKAFVAAMPCGVPEMNMPPMAPLKMDEINMNDANEYRNIQANFSNLYVSGMNKIQLIRYDYNEATGWFHFDINYPQVQALGEYATKIWANMAGFDVHLKGQGLLNMKIIDSRSVGSFKLAPNAQNHMEMTGDKFNFYIGDVEINNWNEDWDAALNNYFNGMLRDFIKYMAQAIQPNFTAFWNNVYLPMVNNGLETVTEEQMIGSLIQMTEVFRAVQC